MTSNPIKVIFAGTPEFAVPSLQALIDSSAEIQAVLTQPDRPAGRGRKLQSSPIKNLADRQSLRILQPARLDEEIKKLILGLEADLLVVAAYGLIIPESIVTAPALGTVNIHASILPKWRGAAPIQRAIEAGDQTTGVTLMQMDAGLDTGAILATLTSEIQPDDTSQTLHDRLASLGAKLLRENLEQLRQGTLIPVRQNPNLACYAKKIDKSEAALDWRHDADTLERKIRALNPWPVAQSKLHGQMIRIWRAIPKAGGPGDFRPGQICLVSKQGLIVQCGAGRLCLTRIQKQGGKPMAAKALANGFGIRTGDTFENPGS